MMWGEPRPNAGEAPRCAGGRKSFVVKHNATRLAEFYRRALSARSISAPVNLVEAAGIEPASRDISGMASTCVVYLLSFGHRRLR